MLSPYDPPPRLTRTCHLALWLTLAAWIFAVWLAVSHSHFPDFLPK